MSFPRSFKAALLSAVMLAGAAVPAAAATIEYQDAKPLKDLISAKARPVSASGKVRLPLITWAATSPPCMRSRRAS